MSRIYRNGETDLFWSEERFGFFKTNNLFMVWVVVVFSEGKKWMIYGSED